MEKTKAHKYKLPSILLTSFILFIGTVYSMGAKANTSTPLAGVQLAYFIGYHNYNGAYLPGHIYYGPRHYRKAYWTGWRPIAHGCRRTCLIDRWTGRAIRCSKRC